MSRGEFRAEVDAPRPASAWSLVAVASACLWITQQLDAWVLVVQPLALVATLARRTRPLACQKSPLALNVGMFAIVAVTIQVALRGVPSTISLAHFAALTQALQLFDARPRRTEFLLVALALFQVVLAANLTDSPLFPPLLVAFVFSTVWTLLVHTLRGEALEAGDPRPVTRALTPGLLRTTLLASGLSMALALVLFVALPRMRSSVVQGPGFAASSATAGFSDRVQLGALGRIRQDATVVMRIETVSGDPPAREEAYWRGLAFDHFDGETWSITPAGRTLVAGSPEGGIELGGRGEVGLVQRIVREPVEAGVLFAAGELRALQGTIRRVERDRNGGVYALGQADVRLRYEASTARRQPGHAERRAHPAVPPGRDGARYLQLPAGSERIERLAREIAKEETRDADRARALEGYLLREGRYSDAPPTASAAGGRPPVERFLFGELAAHCEYFASAFVLLARSIGLPARLVNGFAGGRRNRIGDFVELTRSDAHAWAEVHFRDLGWVRYDATPPDLRARPELAISWSERFRELGSAGELWWYRRVVGFDRSDQMRAVKSAFFAWRGWDAEQRRSRQARAGAAWRPGPALTGALPWLAGAALAGGLVLHGRRRRTRGRDPVPRFYAEALELLARRGHVRPASKTARDFARSLAGELPLAPATAFQALTDAYLAERFGGRPAREIRAPLHALRLGLRRRRSFTDASGRSPRAASQRGAAERPVSEVQKTCRSERQASSR